MSSNFFLKLAVNNLKKNASLYAPFVGMNVIIVAMFYMMHAIAISDGLSQMAGGNSLKMILGFGVVVIGIFSVIALLYTNSFLMKRRQKELGLFNVLGMGKRHLARVIGIETIIVAGVCIVLGLVTGIVLSKLMYMVLLKILSFPMTLAFEISLQSMALSGVVFGVIFVLMLLFNLKNIHLSNPIELIKGGAVGEREPKSKWFMALVGIVTLVVGYGLALSVKSPLDALGTFFIAVVLVISGTYALFTAGSIVILKWLRNNKNFYYKVENFTLVSGMIYRMKRNAVGLANICILSTMVVVSLSSTFSMYMGMEDLADNRYPQEVALSLRDVSKASMLDVRKTLDAAQAEKNVEILNYQEVQHAMLVTHYENGVYVVPESNLKDKMLVFQFVTQATFEALGGEVLSLADNEVVVLNVKGTYDEQAIALGTRSFEIVKEVDNIGSIEKDASSFVDMRFVVMKDEATIQSLVSEMNGEPTTAFDYKITFDIEGSEQVKKDFSQWTIGKLSTLDIDYFYDSRSLSIESFLITYGGMFFIGIFLGSLFLLATVMIMYYKQISEGYEDKARYEIMQKVGMTHAEIRSTIKSQTIGVFFMPLLLMAIHIAFAFNVINRLLEMFSFYNVPLFILCTVGTVVMFGAFYFIIYRMTARAYFKIVKWS